MEGLGIEAEGFGFEVEGAGWEVVRLGLRVEGLARTCRRARMHAHMRERMPSADLFLHGLDGRPLRDAAEHPARADDKRGVFAHLQPAARVSGGVVGGPRKIWGGCRMPGS